MNSAEKATNKNFNVMQVPMPIIPRYDHETIAVNVNGAMERKEMAYQLLPALYHR